MTKWLKSNSHLPKNFVIYLIESPVKMMKNAFLFKFKIFEIFKFLSRLFGPVEKTA